MRDGRCPTREMGGARHERWEVLEKRDGRCLKREMGGAKLSRELANTK